MSEGGSPFEFYRFGRGRHDWYRCYKCNSVFTYEQERARFKAMELIDESKVRMCRCGSLKYAPARLVGPEWFKPAVVAYTLKLVLARGLAPWLEERFPAALPLVEFLVRPKEV